MSKNVSPEILQQLLDYDQNTGELTWRWRSVSWFADGKYTAEYSRNIWNGRFAGKPAFTANDGKDYKHGKIFGRTYLAHRVIWAIVYNEWPEEQIDHINGDRADNRIVNLRAVTNQENQRNAKRRNNNTSGVCGVYWHKHGQKWAAQIQVDGKDKHLGCFVDKTEAVAARATAEIKYGFHKNHGRTS